MKKKSPTSIDNGEHGCYLSTLLNTYPCVPLLSRQYVIPAIHAEVKGVYTNTSGGCLSRAGRPEAAFIIERLIDLAARKTGTSPVDLTKKNFIKNSLSNTGTLTYDMAITKSFIAALELILLRFS